MWSHDINERNQTSSGSKALRILIFLCEGPRCRSRRSLKMQLLVTSSYIWKSISSGLPSAPFFLARGLALKFPTPPPSRVISRPNILPFLFERLPRRLHRTPRFPHPALLLFQTTIHTGSKIDFLEAICRLIYIYNRWRCLATVKFFPKTLRPGSDAELFMSRT